MGSEVKNMDRPFLVGKDIYLRPLDVDDLEGDYLQWVNDEEVSKHMGTLNFPMTKGQLEEYFRDIVKSRKYAFFAIIEKKSNKHIGNVKLGPIDWINRLTEYGRMIGDKKSWGKGYSTEVVELMLKYAFERLNIHKVMVTVVATNTASIKSNEKVALKIEARLKDHVFKLGRWEDMVIMSITQDEYFKMKTSAI